MTNKNIAKELVKIAKKLVARPAYGWIIDKDVLGLGDRGAMGPRNIDRDIVKRLKKREGDKFEMFDSDGELVYVGRIIGEDYEGFEPLDDFGEPNAGATMIRYKSGPLRGSFL